MSLTPLDSRTVTLTEGPFADARARNATYLLSLEPERLLHRYYVNAGLEPSAPHYGGWEQATLSGHSLGHYLSAIARLAVQDSRFLAPLEATLAGLARCQAARTDGFLGGMPEADRVFTELRQGSVRSSGFDLNDCWVPWYNLHKLFAGLLDTAQLCNSTTAKALVTRLGEWALDVTANLDDDAWQRMLACEHGGMNESLAELYALTGDRRFLALAEKFYHRAVLDPLAEGIDCLPGLHGNTQIPKVLGCARLYELTGDDKYRRIAENFWRFVVEHHTYCIGGHGSGEHFGPEDSLAARLSHTNCETCNTYNMLRLTRFLFAWEPRAALYDFAERALYNHILGSQHPETGMFCYFIPLQNCDFRTYSTPFDSFWCCVGTGMENHARYEEYLATATDDTLWVHLYASATIRRAGLTVTLDASLPFGAPTVTFQLAGTGPRTIKLRRPGWLQNAPQFWRNDQPEPLPESDTDGYWSLPWHDGDRWVLQLPQDLVAEPLPDRPQSQALLFGPLVLAADLGPAPEPLSDEHHEPPTGAIPLAPVVVGSTLLSDAGEPFYLASLPKPVALRPFARLHDRRYAVYLDTFTPDEWEREEASYRAAEQRDFARRTQVLDEFWPGQMQPERDHHFASENASAAERSAWKFRQAEPGGWFTFTLKCHPSHPVELLCKWGPPRESAVAFTVAVEGDVIATPSFTVEKHRHIDQTYRLPDALTQGKTQLTVRVAASLESSSAPLFLCRSQKYLGDD